MFFRLALTSAFALTSVLPVVAQQPISLHFSSGRVTLRAQNAPIRTILAEWARLGGATVVNGERVTGPPVTLELANVTEREALDVILRGVAGYMLAPRRTGSTGVSAFDRIMILPTSAAPQNPPPTASAGLRPVPPRPAVIARPPAPALDTPQDSEPDTPPDDPEPQVNPPAIAGNPRLIPPRVVRPVPGNDPTAEDQAADADNADNEEAPTPPPSAVTTPSNPFGVPTGSSAKPGVISPAPRPQQQPPANRVQ
jgi:hypothetical protein